MINQTHQRENQSNICYDWETENKSIRLLHGFDIYNPTLFPLLWIMSFLLFCSKLLLSHGRREMSWKQVLLIILQMLPAHSRCWAVGQAVEQQGTLTVISQSRTRLLNPPTRSAPSIPLDYNWAVEYLDFMIADELHYCHHQYISMVYLPWISSLYLMIHISHMRQKGGDDGGANAREA